MGKGNDLRTARISGCRHHPTSSSSVWSEHGRALLQQPQLFSQGEKPGSAPCTGNIALLSFWITLQLILAWQQADPTPLG